MLPFSLTPLSPAISLQPAASSTQKHPLNRERTKTHTGLCVFFAARNIPNTDLDRSHFAANRTVKGGGGDAGRQAGCHEGEIHTDGLTD